MPTKSSPSIFGPQDFSLVLGGPLYQLLRRVRLSDDALTLARQRVIVMSLLAWVPLLVLALLEGQALPGSATVPFLLDLDVHVRFLLALPLLIAAELVVHKRMRTVAQVFLDRHLIPDSAMPRFEAAVAATIRLRNSVLAEVLIIAVVYGLGILIVWRHYTALDAATWYAVPSAQGSTSSLAGLWYGYVSLPMFQFLLVRWYFRIFIWIRFLWHVSAHRVEPGADAPGSRRRAGLSLRHRLRLWPARDRAWRAAGRAAVQSHLLPGREADRLQDDDWRPRRFPPAPGARTPSAVHGAVVAGETEGPARIRHPGRSNTCANSTASGSAVRARPANLW